MSTRVLVINSGSSSIKYQLLDVETHEALATGLVERIGQPTGRLKHTGPAGTTQLEQPVPDHEAGMALVLGLFEEHGPRLVESPPPVPQRREEVGLQERAELTRKVGIHPVKGGLVVGPVLAGGVDPHQQHRQPPGQFQEVVGEPS